MKKVSFSQFTTWLGCPQSWKLQYVDGHRTYEDTIHTVFGTVMHEVIQDWLDILYNQSETVAKTIYLNDIFREKLIELFKQATIVNENGEKIFLADKKTLMEFYDQGCKIIEYIQGNYKKFFPTNNVKLHSIEFPLEVDLGNDITYVGYVDVITYNELTKKYVLYDLKTSSRGWNDEQKKDPKKYTQLLLYKKFFSEQLGIPLDDISVEFIILKRTIFEGSPYPIPRVSRYAPAHGKPSVNKGWGLFSEFLDNCFDEGGNYISEQSAKPSKSNCRWCPFRDNKDLCQHGVK